MTTAQPSTPSNRRAPRRGRRPNRSDRSAGPGRSSRALTPEQLAARIKQRRALVPQIRYPADLPVSAARHEIADAIRDNQVVVIAGETGSGKTTQLPKILLELGRGLAGMIGHTQPRRIAARSVAERIADELHTELGGVVGYQMRFADHSTKDTLVKVMTDGILLAELQRDRDLRRYDTIIIDEAHERSLNIDFLLGYLKQLLPRRPDLKLIITSATIDPEKFANHFASQGRPAPIIEVSGRTYPVEVRYRPLIREVPGKGADAPPQLVDVDQITGIVDAVEELWSEPGVHGAQDILVFCSGEREIRDAVDALEGMKLPGTEVLPLYARLSAAEQHRVFARHEGRRIVLATNVAETSLTVPGIRYVVDTGTARISRYSQRTKVQRLPIEEVSQASANQRSGRCGRVADGIAIRLYSQEDFEQRPEFTDPEIQRTNLAAVILQMTSLGLGDVSRFPFVDPPDSRQVTDGVRLLEELGAVETSARDKRRRLTAYGRKLAALPVDPRLGRMLIEAADNGSLREVLVIVAALSIQDPRERPAEAKAQADQAHARFKDEQSDFVSYLNLWGYVKEQQKALSNSAFRRMCKREYLHYLRVREWQDLHAQLRKICKEQELRTSDNAASPDTIHQALLTGLLSHVGLRDRDARDYLGARGARFAIQPGSVLFRKQPDWVMSAELVETSRLWARTNARTDPAWVERAAQHLVKRSYSEPHWERKAAGAVALERVTLYGVPLASGRKVALGRIDPPLARELFIRHALVEGDWDTHHKFVADNAAVIKRVASMEARARRRDLLVDDETLVQFYDERIPESVVSAAHFDAWWKKQRTQHPTLLNLTEADVLAEDAESVDASDYPASWRQGELKLRLTYQFEPGADADGVTVHLPIDQLNQVDETGFDWLVPGMREELATALLKSLPKATRRNFVPTPDHARRALAAVDPSYGPITDALAAALLQQTGIRIPAGEWDWSRVPDHLRMTFRVEDPRGKPLGEGKDLGELQERLAGNVRATMARAAKSIERTGLRQWSFGQLPELFEQQRGRRTIQGFPAIVDHGDTVAVEVLPTRSEGDEATRHGIRRLVLLNTQVPWKRIESMLTNKQRLALGLYGPLEELLQDAVACAVDAIVVENFPGGSIRDGERFEEALRIVKQQIVPKVLDVVELAVPVLEAAREVDLMAARMTSPQVRGLRDDLVAHRAELVHKGFLTETGLKQLRQLPRYLRALVERGTKAPLDPARDAKLADDLLAVEEERHKLLDGLPTSRRTDPDVVALRWMLEELRVSFFAQRLGTDGPVSIKRVFKAMDDIEDATDR